MSSVAKCAVYWSVVIGLALAPFSLAGKPPLIPSPQRANDVASGQAAATTNDLVDLWKLIDDAAEKAYQGQTYRDSAAACLIGYLVATAAKDQDKMFRSAWLMAFSYHFQGDAELALGAYQLALDNVIPGLIVEINNDAHDAQVAKLDKDHAAAKTLLNIGVLCTNARKMDLAEQYFERVINLAKLEQPQTEAESWFIRHMLARAQSGLADLYAERFLYDKSIPLYEQSRETFEGELRYARFLERVPEKRLPLRERIGATVDLAHCLGSLGGAYFDKPEPDLVAARKNLEASLRLRQELKNNVYIADSQILLSKIELAEQRFDQAYALAVSAAALTAPGSEGDNPDIHWQALLAEGQSLLKLGRLDQAVVPLKEAISTAENLKDPDLGSEAKSSFFNSVTWFFRQKVSPYVAMAELLVRQDKPLEALRYAELAKARTLLLGKPAGIVGGGESLGSTTITPEELSQALAVDVPDRSTAILEYLRGIDSDYVFLIGRDVADRVTVRVTPVQPAAALTALANRSFDGSVADFDAAIDAFRNQIEKGYAAYPQSLGRALYTALVKPFENELADKTHLVLVPAGKLWELPFQALLLPNAGRLDYLIERYCLSYTPSLLYLERLISRSGHASKGAKVLMFDNLISGDRDPKAGPSFDNLKSALGLEPFSPCEFRFGSAAARTTFLSDAPGSKMIVFSTHAIVGGVDPTQSYFLLTPDPAGDTGGRLTAADIMDERLSANLVILGACETELGRYVEGEGEIGLGWAFLYAGCASTVVSQWKIDRNASLDLTALFCHALAEQLNPPPAKVSLADVLRSAQLKLLSDERYSHPFYWAGMVLVGNPFWPVAAP